VHSQDLRVDTCGGRQWALTVRYKVDLYKRLGHKRKDGCIVFAAHFLKCSLYTIITSTCSPSVIIGSVFIWTGYDMSVRICKSITFIPPASYIRSTKDCSCNENIYLQPQPASITSTLWLHTTRQQGDKHRGSRGDLHTWLGRRSCCWRSIAMVEDGRTQRYHFTMYFLPL